jgi:hypothetical protein
MGTRVRRCAPLPGAVPPRGRAVVGWALASGGARCCRAGGRRPVTVSDRRPGSAGADGIREGVEVHDPDAARSVLVRDSGTAAPASWSATEATEATAATAATVPPAAAQRLADTLESQSTPKHGSGRELAARERRGVTGPGLDRRRPDRATRVRELAAGGAARTAAHRSIAWRLTTAATRITRQQRYPVLHA